MITKLFNIKVLAAVGVVAFLFGSLVGGVSMAKVAAIGESARLEKALELRDREKDAALAAQKTYYENLPPKVSVKYRIKEVIKNVPYNPECDVSPDEQRMLDYSRTGVRADSGGPDEGPGSTGAPEAVERIPRAAEVLAHLDANTRYRECYAVAKAIEVYSKQRVDKSR